MFKLTETYDVIVIGSGHAGIEAALASARIGCRTLMLTQNLDTIGQMSCNPAIGGLAKGQIVREIDALGGAMGLNADATGIQFRLLHIGETSKPGGRMADASSSLSDNLRQLGLESGRFKTGTPCRINARSIDFARCKVQPGVEPPPRFSFFKDESPVPGELFTLNDVSGAPFHVEQMACWITQTNARTHEIIRANLDRSPLYAGRIKGTGPRYCPSIEDKVVKFADREAHQLFLEPEGRHTNEFYVNGISTSLLYEVQADFVRSIPGLEHAEIMRPGYAVEYDFFPPTQLFHTLETKRVRCLYFAGQVNGTSGYEEAAAQGLIAGANAALNVQNRSAFVLGRNEAYIGVLIDDLITKGTEEPYRMFTSRAEDRLQLRHDNADQRLTPKGFDLGLVTLGRLADFEAKTSLLKECG